MINQNPTNRKCRTVCVVYFLYHNYDNTRSRNRLTEESKYLCVPDKNKVRVSMLPTKKNCENRIVETKMSKYFDIEEIYYIRPKYIKT